jgi:two-component system, NtrC family, response regulator
LPDTAEKPPLLIVEDDEAALRQLRWTFERYAVDGTRNRRDALAACRRQRFPVVLLDLGLPGDLDGASEGLAALREILELQPEAKVIVVTGREERASALRAVELGAYDYYRKPVEADEIQFLVARALQLHELQAENRRLAREARGEPLPGVVCVSEAMRHVCALIERAARSEISVLLVGESGTGKEVLAQALHAVSRRSDGPLVAINCAAIPESLLESELFGHERGSFTGADRRVIGRLEGANGGTLFLDELAEIPNTVQVKLLRFLQERVIQRVGGREDLPVDARLVSATNRPLEQLTSPAGGLREDLFYRVSELLIEVPPLRARPEDAVLLAQHFLQKHAKQRELPLEGLASDAVAAVARHDWPGNVRELENRMKRAIVLAAGPRLCAADLGLSAEDGRAPADATLRETVGAAERERVTRAWVESGHNVSRASRQLGVSRPTLYKLLRTHGLGRE